MNGGSSSSGTGLFGGILASLLWFLAGEQVSSNRQPSYVMFWQGIAVFIIVVLCGWTIVEREWLGLLIAIAILSVEVSLMKQNYVRRGGQGRASAPPH